MRTHLKMKISMAVCAGICLVLLFLNGSIISKSSAADEAASADSNQPVQTAPPEQSGQPSESPRAEQGSDSQSSDRPAQPGRPAEEGQGEQMRPSRRGGFRSEGSGGFPMRSDGQRGFGGRGFDGGERFMRPGPVTAAGAGDPNTPMEAINLNNIEMRQVIQKLAEWTGKPVIPVNDEIMQIRVTIYSPTMVTREQALNLLIMALQARGIVVEQLDNRVMLRPLATIRLGSVPTLGPDEPLARIEDKTQIVEKWFRLNNYSPTRLIQIITPLTAEYGYAVADEATSRVAVIDTVENLMRIERLIQQLDLPESGQEVELIIELKYADPAEVVQMLQLILSEGQSSRSGGRSSGYRGGSSPSSNPSGPPSQSGGGRGGSSGGEIRTATSVVVESGTAIPIRMIPLVRQRWIIVRGAREDVDKVEEWAKKLDIEEVEEMKQTVVQVRYADVREVVRMVQNTIQQMPGTEVRANIVVEALTQTNQIVIYGTDSNRAMVERLIAQIDLPKEDYFVERTFQLKHADPDQIKTNIEELYADTTPTTPFGRFGYSNYNSSRNTENTVRVIAYSMLKQVTVIASPQNMERIARQIQEEWDKPLDVERDQYRIVSLSNSDPVKLADLLKTLFSEDSSSASTQNFFRMIFGGSQDSRQKIVGSLYGMLTFEPVPDTKKLIVISQVPEAYDVIERLIEKLDARDEADVPRVITLQYADPEALCDQLNAILNEPGTPATIQRSVRGLSAYDASQTNQEVTTSEEGSGTITPWWTRQRPDSTQMPTSNLIGRVRFVPVHRSKAILVLAPPEYLEDITRVIGELDRPGMQVMIKAIIVEINLSDLTSLGIQLASNEAFSSTLGPNALTALNRLSYRDVSTSTSNTSTTPFGVTTTADINVLVDMLVKHANGRVLNQPTLWTKDNEEAIFVKGRKVAFITGEQTANTGSTQKSYNFEDVGVTLRIRPNITPEKAVDLTINLNISQIESEQINEQNVRSNLDSTTRLIVNDGQSVMMGGILYQIEDTLRHKIPLLGDLPLVGGVFRHEMVTKTNNELLVFITPYVVDEKALGNIPSEGNALDVMDDSKQKMKDAADALSRMFMTGTEAEPTE